MQPDPIAHVKLDDDGTWVVHALESHLMDVALLSAQFAEKFGNSDWAYLAGLWHDLGKYRPAFQAYIKCASGYDPDAHIENGKGKVDHSTAGAVYAEKLLGKKGRILSYLIAGHHAGLPDWLSQDGSASALSTRLLHANIKAYLDEALENSPPSSILEARSVDTNPLGGTKGCHLWMRMLFSCLVDADFLDTEAFMDPEKARLRNIGTELPELKAQFDAFMAAKVASAKPSTVNEVRSRVLHDCRVAGQRERGIFTLTVPTGGGKTLSSMAFALEHAIKHKLDRIIIVIPYTSIIEQTADEYRKIFGDVVLEHHSNLTPDVENAKSRLASENWNAPIIVTTNVQLLESLFAAKTSRCRKLHNITNSVIVFDEAQLLPPNFLQPILDILRALVDYYGVSLVLATATQPALSSRKDAHGRTRLHGLDNAIEIITDVDGLYRSLNRVRVEKPNDFSRRVAWADLAVELQSHKSVLVIVNTRKDCRDLFALMPKGTLHLSALMCGEHRSKVIAIIKQKLRDRESVRVISTQLVEAGVDLDFPVVYRALAGLDSIAQAAGRCNREGKLENGQVVVFVPPNAPPKGMLTFGEQATRSVWYGIESDLLSRHLYTPYFEQFFSSVDNDEYGIHEMLSKDAASMSIQFRSAAEKFNLINDAGTQSVLVPYDDRADSLIGLLRKKDINRGVLRQLQRYCVNIYQNEFNKLCDMGAVEQLQPEIWAVCVSNAYDDICGLLTAVQICSGKPEQSVI